MQELYSVLLTQASQQPHMTIGMQAGWPCKSQQVLQCGDLYA